MVIKVPFDKFKGQSGMGLESLDLYNFELRKISLLNRAEE